MNKIINFKRQITQRAKINGIRKKKKASKREGNSKTKKRILHT